MLFLMALDPLFEIGQKTEIHIVTELWNIVWVMQLKTKTEAAYQRDDLLEQRSLIMNSWNRYCF